MGDYQRSIDVAAPSGRLFDYLADVHNLPQYFASMKSAERSSGESVDVVADVQGTERHGEAWFHVDEERRHLRWGSEGSSNYHGELDIAGDDETSTVTVKLHTERVDSGAIESGLAQTLDNVKRLVESGPAPGPTDAA